MFEELKWLNEGGMSYLFRKADEDTLREVIRWLDGEGKGYKSVVLPVLNRELDRRAVEAYERMNGGEWI